MFTSVVGSEYPIQWAMWVSSSVGSFLMWVSFPVWVEYALGRQQQWVGDAAGSGGRSTPAAAMPMPMPNSTPVSHPYAHLLPGPTYLPPPPLSPDFPG